MAYRSFRGGSGRLRHPPRYAAYLTPSSPSFPHSSSQRRAVVIIDEQPNEATIYDVTILTAQQALEEVQQDPAHAETIGPHVQALVDHMRAHAYGSSLEKPP